MFASVVIWTTYNFSLIIQVFCMWWLYITRNWMVCEFSLICLYFHTIHTKQINTFTYMKRSFPKFYIHQWKNVVCNGNPNFWDHDLQRALHKYSHICKYTYMKSSFPRDNLWAWQWHCKPIFWNGAYYVFEKSFSCMHVYAHTKWTNVWIQSQVIHWHLVNKYLNLHINVSIYLTGLVPIWRRMQGNR